MHRLQIDDRYRFHSTKSNNKNCLARSRVHEVCNYTLRYRKKRLFVCMACGSSILTRNVALNVVNPNPTPTQPQPQPQPLAYLCAWKLSGKNWAKIIVSGQISTVLYFKVLFLPFPYEIPYITLICDPAYTTARQASKTDNVLIMEVIWKPAPVVLSALSGSWIGLAEALARTFSFAYVTRRCLHETSLTSISQGEISWKG